MRRFSSRDGHGNRLEVLQPVGLVDVAGADVVDLGCAGDGPP
ncbi:hypothetical protein [uncultured Pseudokineococcus sp.]|nr:hypothetical protein [uncultured Pseudokineococcus sp.]